MESTLTPGIPLNTLVPAIKANDQNVLSKIYRENYRSVEQYILKNSGTIDDAKDIYQEAFVATWRNIQLDKFQVETTASLSAYLFQIAKNKWLDHLRYKKARPVVISDDSKIGNLPGDQTANENSDYLDAVQTQFRLLGERCRDLLNRFYYQKQSIRDIAASFGWTEPSAKNNKYRCLEELRTLVKKNVKK